ncbi:MAG TPA: zinc-ribbon domain-containing protein [Candidatus Limnocylindrales bacterium]|nr:zinc-ribbon domain-containing protein [Candidatus Limnocylindrales bacterium]
MREQAHRFDKFREVIMAFCASCGTQMADNAAFCPNCGKAASQASGTGASAPPPPTPAPPASYGSIGAPSAPMEENIAGMLAYFTFIPAIIFLLIEPYNRNRFVRFHSFQCLFTCAALIVIEVILMIFMSVLHVVGIGWIIGMILWPLLWLAFLALWLLVVIKAYQHQMFKLPVVGDIAEKQAGA